MDRKAALSALNDISLEMLEVAAAQQWEKLLTLEQEEKSIIAQLDKLPKGELLPSFEEDTLQKVLDRHSKILNYVEPVRNDIAALVAALTDLPRAKFDPS